MAKFSVAKVTAAKGVKPGKAVAAGKGKLGAGFKQPATMAGSTAIKKMPLGHFSQARPSGAPHAGAPGGQNLPTAHSSAHN